MKKRIISLFAAVALLSSLVSEGTFAGDAETKITYSPRSVIDIFDGTVRGITEPVTADWVASQFDCDVILTDSDGRKLAGDVWVPSDSTVVIGDETVARIVVPGDTNRNGFVNLSDVTMMMKSVAKWNVDLCYAAADTDKNGKLSINDAAMVLKYIAKWDISLGSDAMLDVSFDEYVLLSGDPERDREIVEGVESRFGKDVTVVTEVTEGMKYITLGRELWNEYGFIDTVRCRSLFPENAYIDTYGGNIYLTACGDEGISECVEYLLSAAKLSIPKGYTGTVGHMTGESEILYAEAVKRIEAAGLKGGTANEMTEDIYTALVNAKYTEPKNVILMIGDGMGKSAVTGAEIVYSSELHDSTLAMKHMPSVGSSQTYSDRDQYTDSAAGATALATGYKTSECTVAMSSDHSENYKTVLEIAADLGKSTGIVVTNNVADATPASFTSHVEDRYMWSEIAISQLEYLSDGTLDLVLGGGYDIYDREDVKETLAAAKTAGVTYTKYWSTAKNAALPLAGLFAKDAIYTNPETEYSLAAMTELALERLSEDNDGFFLMVEGSKIDSYAHNNLLEDQLGETYEFDCAISVALRYAALNPDTVVIVTADHETGGLRVNPDSTIDNVFDDSYYLMKRHHWVNVPIYAVGYGTGVLADTVENTDIGIFMGELFGEDIGKKSNRIAACDLTNPETVQAIIDLNPGVAKATENGLNVNFTPKSNILRLPLSMVSSSSGDTSNVRAVNITYKSRNDASVVLPALYLVTDDGETVVEEWWNFVKPDEYYTQTYVMPVEFVGEGLFGTINELKIVGGKSRNYNYTITDITVVERPMGS